MTTRRSYNAAHTEWVAKMRRKNPEMAALWGTTDITNSVAGEIAAVTRDDPTQSSAPATGCEAGTDLERDLALEETCRRLYGKVPRSDAERYAAEQALDAQPSGVNGRGED